MYVNIIYEYIGSILKIIWEVIERYSFSKKKSAQHILFLRLLYYYAA